MRYLLLITFKIIIANQVFSADFKKFEAYLNSAQTLSAEFIQIGSSGKVETGTLKLKKPGKLLLEYDLPSGHLVVADNGILAIIDPNSNTEPLRYPISQTPLELLSKKKLNLNDKDFMVIVTEDSDGIHLELSKKTEAGFGKLILTFDEETTILKNWSLLNENGSKTKILLENLKINEDIDDKVFLIAPKIMELNLKN